MAKLPAYKLYRDGVETRHVGNNLQELIGRGEQLGKIFGDTYQVKDTYGNVIWEGKAWHR